MRKSVLVCGASGAIGQQIAQTLAAEGYNVYLHYSSNKERVAQLVNQLSEMYVEQEFYVVQGDFTDPQCAEVMKAQIFALHAIVFANGHALYNLLEDTTQQEMRTLWQVHVETPMLLCKALAPKLRQHDKSSILFISSIWGEVGASFEVAYSAVKGAQNSFVKSYAQEVAYNGIRVNAVAPGIIETAMNAHLSEEDEQMIKEEIPLQRFGKPQEVADLVAYVLSDKAAYMTGQILRLNGGWYI